MAEIKGIWQNKFAGLVDAFRENFLQKREIGAAACVYYRGEKVADIWAGGKDAKTREPWSEHTLTTVFSVTKALTSLCFLILARRKKFDYDRPVAHYWPDFALGGKKEISCRLLLEHRAGLYAVETPLHIRDFSDNPRKIYDALIKQKPFFVPGSMQAYGAQVWGAYAGELFRRVSGESVGTFFSREVAKKLGAACFIGLPAQYENEVATLYPLSVFDRVTALVPDIIKGDTTEGRVARAFLSGNRSIEQAYMNPSMGPKSLGVFNEPWIRALELPWAGGVTNARALAQIMNVLALGGSLGKVRFADTDLMPELMRENPLRYDLVLQKPLGWNLGFLKEERGLFSPNTEAFGHSGMGGSLALADPKAKLAFGYVCNKMDYKIRPDKTLALCKALYACIQKSGE